LNISILLTFITLNVGSSNIRHIIFSDIIAKNLQICFVDKIKNVIFAMIIYSNSNSKNSNKIMTVTDIDFEGAGGQNTNTNDNNNGGAQSNQEDVTHLNGSDVPDINNSDQDNNNSSPDNKDGNNNDDNNKNNNGNNNNSNGDNLSTGELNAGDQIEVDGVTYTVSENGDVVDADGNVFKAAADVADWLKTVDINDDNDSNPLSLSSIQEAVGITINDENGNPVEFTEDADGVKSYIDSVINLRSAELQQAAINRLYQDNPLLKQFQDYVQLKGTPRGFGDIPDRSGIRLDKENESQLVAVIKMAATEFGNKSLNDNYIKYLRDSGSLYDEAKTQLAALIDKDKAYRKDIEKQAAAQRQQEADELKAYWEKVNNMIKGRVINGYKIPDSFTKEVDGKKVVITPNDFFNYVSNASVEREDGSKITGYQRDLAELTDEEYMAREMLDAWLMFTGGTYKDLIDMAVKENEVRKLIVKSKQNRSTKTVKIVKKQNGKTNIDDIIL